MSKSDKENIQKKNYGKIIGFGLIGCGMLTVFIICIIVHKTTSATINTTDLETDVSLVTNNAAYWSLTEETAISDETVIQENTEQELAGSFTVTYQGQKSDHVFELRYCDQIYNANGIQVYAKYLDWVLLPESFPYNQYVLYIQTPQEQVQLYPVKDFLVHAEQGTLYTKIAGNDGFESVQCISLMEKSDHILDSQREILNAEQAEKMLRDTYGRKSENVFAEVQMDFSNVTVELTGTESAGILYGETGGVKTATGQRYYVDWEIDTSDNRQRVTPCSLKQYDPINDCEIFADSSRIFDQIEQGDWSCVKPIDGMEYLWEYRESEWLRADVNGDGLPELINGFVIAEMPEYENSKKISISCIFAYQNKVAELVYADVNDGMEFLFIAGNGNLVYEWSVSGGPGTDIARLCQFDLKWNREYLDTLVRYDFPEEDESMSEYYQKNYPDTYGVGGEGVYYLRERRKTEKELEDNEDGKYTVREYLTRNQFLDAYKKMTGWDF
ncbi:MAG: hypothetical protein K2O91_10300 [Lachnospiraceae bacterium]|nr:hypothetical protein [Lachnospiraceae bacterium]